MTSMETDVNEKNVEPPKLADVMEELKRMKVMLEYLLELSEFGKNKNKSAPAPPGTSTARMGSTAGTSTAPAATTVPTPGKSTAPALNTNNVEVAKKKRKRGGKKKSKESKAKPKSNCTQLEPRVWSHSNTRARTSTLGASSFFGFLENL